MEADDSSATQLRSNHPTHSSFDRTVNLLNQNRLRDNGGGGDDNQIRLRHLAEQPYASSPGFMNATNNTNFKLTGGVMQTTQGSNVWSQGADSSHFSRGGDTHQLLPTIRETEEDTKRGHSFMRKEWLPARHSQPTTSN